jgi:CcmD family protein
MIPYAISIQYMLAGYVVVFIVLAAYLFSLFIRWKSLKRDLQTYENNLEEQP